MRSAFIAWLADLSASRSLLGLISLALLGCGEKSPPAVSPPAATPVTALGTPESTLTRVALERGYLAHDPFATLAAASSVSWQHGGHGQPFGPSAGGLVVRPLTGALVVVAEDLRLPLETADLVLARTLLPGAGAAGSPPQVWDEHFGLGPQSPRCALGAACDADGRVLRWQEDGQLFNVTWEGAHPRSIAAGGRTFAELRQGQTGLAELRAGRIGTTAPADAWLRASYTRDAAGRLAQVDVGGASTRYDYDANARLVAITQGSASTRISYDAADRVTALDGPGTLATRFAYANPAAAGLRSDVTITDAVGQTTRFTWSTPSAAGTHEVRAGAGPRALVWVFDAAGRLLVHEAAGAQTRFAHDAAGRLVEVRHPDGLTQRIERSADGRLASIAEGARTTSFTLSAGGDIATLGTSERDRENWTWSAPGGDTPARLVRIDRAGGRFEAFTRDAAGRVVRFENDAGAITEYRYDPVSGLVASTRDERGAEVAYGYDEAGRLIRRSGPEGSDESWSWHGDGRLVSHVAPGGATTRFEYDADARLARVVRAGGAITWTHDALGRVLSETTPLGTTTLRWSGPDLVEITQPGGPGVRRELDAFGRLVREVASDGTRRELTWAAPDAGGQLLREVVPGVGERRFSWDPLARLARLEELSALPGASRDIRFSYPDDGRVELADRMSATTWSYHRLTPRPGAPASLVLGSTSTLTGGAEGYSYDAHGALSEKTSSVGDGFALTYDLLGRPTAIASAAAGTTRISWTPAGRVATIDNDLGGQRRYEYDAAGRPTIVAEGASRWSLGYGATSAEVAELVDPAGRRTTFTWDAHHRLAARTTPMGASERFGYDDAGRLVAHTRADGSAHGWRYDEAGRLAGHDIDGSAERNLTWDAEGRVVRDEGPGHVASYSFDDTTRTRVSRDERAAVTTGRTRDEAGRTAALAIDGAPHARYLRRSDGLLTRVEGPSGFAIDVDHDTFGRRTGLRLAGGGTIKYKHDAARRLIGIEVGGSAGVSLAVAFAYDAGGRLTTLTSADRTLQYSYDSQLRLSAVILPDGTRREYGWSAAGDLVRIGTAELRLDDAGRPIAGPGGARTWDGAGRMTTRGRVLPETLVHDRAGRLTRVERPGQPLISYRYDGDGRLIGRTEGASEIRLVLDGDELLAEQRDGRSIQHIPGEAVGERFGFVDPASGGPRYLVQAPDGSTLAVIGGDGQVLTTYLHEPLGTLVGAQDAAPDAFHYRGRYTDPATGLVHFALRWYDPEIGAYCAPDPDAGDFMSPATLNRYAYLAGDPVNRVDPFGAQAHEWQTGSSCLEQVCNLFQQGKISAGHAFGKALENFDYAGAIEKNGWNYDIWVKKIPGTDKVVTIFRDLNEKAEGYFGKANLTGNLVLKDPPAITQPLGGAAPTTAGNAGSSSSGGSTIRDGLNQVKQGLQTYGKEITTTVGGLGGISGTLGTGVGTLAALPGGMAIIGAGAAIAGVIGYGLGTAINMIPGVSEGAQGVLISVMGYDKDQALADLKAKLENEGAKAKEHAAKTIADNLKKDTMPPPPEPGIAGGPVSIGEPPRPDRDRPHADPDAAHAPDTGDDTEDDDGEDDDDDEDGEDEDGEPEPDSGVVDILKRVAAKQISVTFKTETDVSSGEFKNIVTCTQVLTFWNVGALAPGYGTATISASCVASLNGSRADHTGKGTFSGGPSGTVVFEGASLQLHGGATISIPEVGERALPAGAFSDWPEDLR